MTEAVLVQEKSVGVEFVVPSWELVDIAGVAKDAVTWGLERCAQRMGLDGPQAAVRHLQQGDSMAHACCCYGLAERIAEFLGAWDKNVQAVYTLDFDDSPEGLYLVYPLDYEATPQGPCPGEWTQDAPLIHLLVWTEHRANGLDSLVADLDRALAQAYVDATGTCGLTTLLDVQTIDDAYVEDHVGSSEFRNWLYLRPIRLWKR